VKERQRSCCVAGAIATQREAHSAASVVWPRLLTQGDSAPVSTARERRLLMLLRFGASVTAGWPRSSSSDFMVVVERLVVERLEAKEMQVVQFQSQRCGGSSGPKRRQEGSSGVCVALEL